MTTPWDDPKSNPIEDLIEWGARSYIAGNYGDPTGPPICSNCDRKVSDHSGQEALQCYAELKDRYTDGQAGPAT